MTAIATLPVLLGTGIHSARPAATDVGSGGLYSCTTHSLVYQTDGATWTTWATLSAGLDLDATIAASAGQDIADALAGAAAPDAGNVFATMADVGGGGGLVLLEQHTGTNAAQYLNFQSFISSTYDTYVFQVVNALPASNGVELQMQMGTGGGPTYDTTSGHYMYTAWRWLPSAAAQGGSTSTTYIGIDGGVGTDPVSNTASGGGVAGSLTLYDPQNSAINKLIKGECFINSTNGIRGGTYVGAFLQTTAVTAVRFGFASGNFFSGTIRAYGVAK